MGTPDGGTQVASGPARRDRAKPPAADLPGAGSPSARERLLSGRSSLKRKAVKGSRDVAGEVRDLGAVTDKAARAARQTREAYELKAPQNPPAKEPAASSHRFEPHLPQKHLNSVDYDTRQERDLEPNYELEDEQAEEDYERTRPQLSYGGLARLPVVLIIVAGVVATISWQWSAITEFYQLLSHIGSKSHSQVSHETPSARSKFSGRIRLQQGDGQAPSAVAPGGQTEAAAAQRVVLYEEDPSDPQGKRYIGSAIWRTETVSPDTGIAPELAVRADVEIPERGMTVTWSLRRNTDKALPASYTIETVFNLSADFPGGGIADVPGILMKQAEQARGTELAGLAVRVTKGFFLIGLSAGDSDMQRNEQLLKDRSWFDIPIVYANGGRALLAMEKGPPGARAFAEAFAVWEKK